MESQLTIFDVLRSTDTEGQAEYDAFVEKFKPKKTTDDCYTPAPVFDVIVAYVRDRYGLDPHTFVRPFFPGGDYERMEYAPDAVVVDNPPFSIVSQIVRFYMARGIRFFLFAPYLTVMGIGHDLPGLTKVITDADIIYENGAEVNTCFVTNLEPGVRFRSDPDLCSAVTKASKEAQPPTTKLPSYSYPEHVATSTMIGNLSRQGVEVSISEAESFFIRHMDAQKAVGKGIFGSGYLLSDKAAAKLEAAKLEAAKKKEMYSWHLSPRERDIVDRLNERSAAHGE